MNQSQYNQLFSFIWNIATDVLVYAFEKGQYKNIIMPMMVLRRIDVLLEPTKEKLLAQKTLLDENGIINQDPILYQVTGYPFYNTSKFTMKTLKSEIDPLRLKQNFTDYLNGYSKDVLDIIEKFHLRQMVDNLTEAERLGSIIEKFTDDKINLSNKPVLDDEGKVKLPALDNHTMGTIFEELLRKFNEENNVTEAGEHFTPRDYVKLLADLAVMPVADRIEDNTYHIYDGACGTGGILTIAKERIQEVAKEKGKKVSIDIFGQELTPETYATCKADLMMSGSIPSFQYQQGTEQREYIAFDSTLSRDGHAGETYDFCISNPPFGTPWKEDLKKRGLGESDKKKFTDSRFELADENGKIRSFLPDIGDCQMMFLANNLSRMRKDTALGTRIVEVHNGSSLFTGDAGSGASNLRQYIIEHDLLEAIVAMPEKDFYNTGIGTFIWVITNRKEERRKGFVQLIDATEIKSPLRKNLGEKNCETSDDDRRAIMKLLMDFKETPQSKIFSNNEFGYWSVKVERPLRESITLNREVLQKAVNALVRKEVEISEECADKLLCCGVVLPPKEEIPELEDGTSIFDEQYAKLRKLKLPKTIGQLLADIALSQSLITFCDMMEEKEVWLDLHDFELRFNKITQARGINLKYNKVEAVLPIYPERNPQAEPVLKNGKQIADPKLRDTEIIPFRYEGGIDGFLKNEVLPYTPDAWIDEKSIVTGYELSFTKYFYKPKQLRTIDEINKDIRGIEERTDGLLNEILSLKKAIADAVTKGLNPDAKMKDSGISWIGEIPEHWEVRQLRSFLTLFSEKGHGDAQLLSVTREQGVIERDKEDKEENHNFVPDDLSGYKYIEKGDFAINKMKAWQGSYAVSEYNGIVSPAYFTCKLKGVNKDFFSKAIRSKVYVPFFTQYSKGIRVGQWDLNPNALKSIPFFLPTPDEQQVIVAYIEEKCQKIDKLASELQSEIDYLKEYKQRLIADCVTGQVKV